MVQLEALENRLRQDADPDKAAIFAAHREILRDPDLLDIASSAIDKGKSGLRLARAYTTYADRLAGLKNELLAQRATDVRDVGQRVLEEVTGQRREKADIPEGTILSPRTSRRRTPPRWTGRRWWASAPWPAVRRRTSRSSPGPWTSRRSRVSSRGRWTSPTAPW